MALRSLIISSDHAGSKLREALVEALRTREDLEIVDIGPPCSIGAASYSREGFKLAEAVINLEGEKKAVIGVGICGTGIGISMALNRYSKIRAARICSKEDAYLAVRHNNANVLVLGGRQLEIEQALEFIKVALETEFEGGRHIERVDALLEKGV